MPALRRFFLIFALAIVFLPFLTTKAEAGFWNSYPRDGKFKQLPARADMWYYIDDERWATRALDKWQHFIGGYLSQKLLQKKFGKWKAFLITEGLVVLKEIDDGYREGWSPRDLIVDNLGILGAMISNEQVKFTGSYDIKKVMVRAHFVF